MTGKTIQTNQLPYWLAILILCLVIWGCNSRKSNSGSAQNGNVSATNGTETPADHATKAWTKTASGTNIKFRSYEVIDAKQGGLATYRLAVPQDYLKKSF